MYNLIDFRKYFFDKYCTQEWMQSSREKYKNAQPFSHIVIDDFLPEEILDAVIKSFASYDPRTWVRYVGDTDRKLTSRSDALIPQITRSVLHELNSGFFLDWLSILTNTPRLISDSRLHGGGMHLIEKGGYLHIHTDFNILTEYGLERQLNLLLYLNKDWKDEYNGHLELWNADKTACVQKIAPIFNRCVIFNIHDKSWHGHPEPLNTPRGINRKSLALYYYNVSDEAVKNSAKKYRPTLFELT